MMRPRRARFRTLTHAARGERGVGPTGAIDTAIAETNEGAAKSGTVRLSEPQRVGAAQADGGGPIRSCLRKYLRPAATSWFSLGRSTTSYPTMRAAVCGRCLSA